MTFASQLSAAFTPISGVYDYSSTQQALSWAQSFVQSYCLANNDNGTFDLVTGDVAIINPQRYRTAMLPAVPVVNVDSVLGLLPPGVNNMPTLSDTPSTTGGTFTAGTYFWVVTALVSGNENNPSNEVTATLTGTTSSVGLSWTSVPFATGYNIYRGIGASMENVLVGTTTSATTFTDTGAAGTPAVPPRGLVWKTLTNYAWVAETGLLYDTSGQPGVHYNLGATWPWVPGGLKVTYDHGYSTIPQPLIDVSCRLAQQYLANPSGVLMQKVGDLETRFAGSAGIPLNDMDKRILDRYTEIGIA